jgi:hypothetical protein
MFRRRVGELVQGDADGAEGRRRDAELLLNEHDPLARAELAR